MSDAAVAPSMPKVFTIHCASSACVLRFSSAVCKPTTLGLISSIPLVLMLRKTFLNAVPASAPFIPFDANTSTSAEASFNCIPALLAAVPAPCNAVATSEIPAVPFCELFANISTTCADSEADTSN